MTMMNKKDIVILILSSLLVIGILGVVLLWRERQGKLIATSALEEKQRRVDSMSTVVADLSFMYDSLLEVKSKNKIIYRIDTIHKQTTIRINEYHSLDTSSRVIYFSRWLRDSTSRYDTTRIEY